MNIIPAGITGVAGDVHAPSAATAAVVTYAAQAQVAHVISGVAFSLSVAPAAAVNLKIEDGASTIFSIDIPAAGPLWGTIEFPRPKKGSVNSALTITLASGAGAVVSKVDALSHWTENT